MISKGPGLALQSIYLIRLAILIVCGLIVIKMRAAKL